MKPWDRFYVFTVPVVLALVLSALAVRPAFADGAPPPSDAPTGITSPSSSSSSDNASSGQLAGNHPAADDSGRHTALARQQAAELVVNGDPVWCPSGVAPHNGTAGCTPSFANLSTLVATIVPHHNGTIWVQSGTDTGLEVAIDGTGTWSPDASFALTLQGGWKGVYGSMGLNKAYPFTKFGHAINITNWFGPLTIKNIIIQNVTVNAAHGGTAALYVTSKGSITLKNVLVRNTTGLNLDGAWLRNEGSTTFAPVSVQSSQFILNNFGGLRVFSSGAVTLKYIEADDNITDDGVFVLNNFNSSTKPVTVLTATFRNNASIGMEITSRGAVTLSNLTAIQNTGRGVSVNNSCSTCFAPVSVSGVNNFSYNQDYGLYVKSYGAIKVSRTTANFNTLTGDGVGLFNELTPLGQPSVTILGSLTAFGNTNRGLVIRSKGAVSAVNLNTSHNTSYGTYIDNTFAPLGFPKPVTITGTNVFNDNTNADGLNISSDGAVKLSNLTASGNGYLNGASSIDVSGVFINNMSSLAFQSPVTITGRNSFVGNSFDGLTIFSVGAVTLSNLTAQNNGLGAVNGGGDGAFVGNLTINIPKPVTLLGTNLFTGSDGSGLDVLSSGSITVSRITSTFNRGRGALLSNVSSAVQSKVTILGYGVFTRNGSGGSFLEGLRVDSRGAITLANISASHNIGNGALISTKGIALIGSPRPVTLTGNNSFNFNGAYGLQVNADGNITANNLTASYNSADGAVLDNYTNWSLGSFPTFGSVKVTGGHFIGNSSLLVNGLYVLSEGSVTLNRVVASYNSAGLASGIKIVAFGNAKIMCSQTIGNVLLGIGVNVTLPGTRTLRLLGVTNFGNAVDEAFTGGFAVVRGGCP